MFLGQSATQYQLKSARTSRRLLPLLFHPLSATRSPSRCATRCPNKSARTYPSKTAKMFQGRNVTVYLNKEVTKYEDKEECNTVQDKVERKVPREVCNSVPR